MYVVIKKQRCVDVTGKADHSVFLIYSASCGCLISILTLSVVTVVGDLNICWYQVV
jgi:hypothetical protein